MGVSVRSLCCFLVLVWTSGLVSLGMTESGARKAKSSLPKPDLSVDEARMIVKEIPSVDIAATLGRWKLAEGELVLLRQWSGILVENPSASDFLPKWSLLVGQAASRNPDIKESDVTPLIRLLMLAAYEEAEKQTEVAESSPSQSNAYKELQERIRENITQARTLQALLGPRQPDPRSGSGIALPAPQRTLRHCEVVGQPAKVECKQILVSTTFELDAYISNSQKQLKAAEEAAQKVTSSGGGQEKRRQTLYALSDVAKLMHDAALSVMRK